MKKNRYFFLTGLSLLIHLFLIFIFDVQIDQPGAIEVSLMDMKFYQEHWSEDVIEFPSIGEKLSPEFHDFDQKMFVKIDRAHFPVKYQFWVKRENHPYFILKAFQHKQFLKNLPKLDFSEKYYGVQREYDHFEPEDFHDLTKIYQELFDSSEKHIDSQPSRLKKNENNSRMIIWGPLTKFKWVDQLKTQFEFQFKDFSTHRSLRARFWVEKEGLIIRVILEKGTNIESINNAFVDRILSIKIDLKDKALDHATWGVIRLSEGEKND